MPNSTSYKSTSHGRYHTIAPFVNQLASILSTTPSIDLQTGNASRSMSRYPLPYLLPKSVMLTSLPKSVIITSMIVMSTIGNNESNHLLLHTAKHACHKSSFQTNLTYWSDIMSYANIHNHTLHSDNTPSLYKDHPLSAIVFLNWLLYVGSVIQHIYLTAITLTLHFVKYLCL